MVRRTVPNSPASVADETVCFYDRPWDARYRSRLGKRGGSWRSSLPARFPAGDARHLRPGLVVEAAEADEDVELAVDGAVELDDRLRAMQFRVVCHRVRRRAKRQHRAVPRVRVEQARPRHDRHVRPSQVGEDPLQVHERHDVRVARPVGPVQLQSEAREIVHVLEVGVASNMKLRVARSSFRMSFTASASVGMRSSVSTIDE